MIRKTPPTWPVDGSGDASADNHDCKTAEAGASDRETSEQSTVSPADRTTPECSTSGSNSTKSKDNSSDLSSSSSSKCAGKVVSSKRNLEAGGDSDSSTVQKKMKRKDTGRPNVATKKTAVKKADALEKSDKTSGSPAQRKGDDSTDGVRQQVNEQREKLKEYVKTKRENYYGLHRSTTM